MASPKRWLPLDAIIRVASKKEAWRRSGDARKWSFRRMGEPLVRISRIVQVTDQFTRWTIDIGSFKIVQLFASEIIDLCSKHHRNLNASAVENFPAHD